MQKFWDGWLRPFAPWVILLTLFIYGAGLGWILPRGQPETWNDILLAHMYASHMGVLVGVACWLFAGEESAFMRRGLAGIALISTILYLTDFWGRATMGADIPLGAYLRGGALGMGYVSAIWVVKYSLLPEFKKLFGR